MEDEGSALSCWAVNGSEPNLSAGLAAVSQTLLSSKLFSTSLTHLDLSGNPGCLATQEATVQPCTIQPVPVGLQGVKGSLGHVMLSYVLFNVLMSFLFEVPARARVMVLYGVFSLQQQEQQCCFETRACLVLKLG